MCGSKYWVKFTRQAEYSSQGWRPSNNMFVEWSPALTELMPANVNRAQPDQAGCKQHMVDERTHKTTAVMLDGYGAYLLGLIVYRLIQLTHLQLGYIDIQGIDNRDEVRNHAQELLLKDADRAVKRP